MFSDRFRSSLAVVLGLDPKGLKWRVFWGTVYTIAGFVLWYYFWWNALTFVIVGTAIGHLAIVAAVRLLRQRPVWDVSN